MQVRREIGFFVAESTAGYTFLIKQCNFGSLLGSSDGGMPHKKSINKAKFLV